MREIQFRSSFKFFAEDNLCKFLRKRSLASVKTFP